MMNRNVVGDVLYLTFPLFEEIPFVRHAFSTRLGGVSTGVYASMNLGFGRGDIEENVLTNYAAFCHATGVDMESLVSSDQTHTANIREVFYSDRGTGFHSSKDRTKPWHDVDGLVTGDAGVTLVTHFADCVPLFFIDPIHRIVAAAHAGWKGTVLGIAARMVETMKELYSCDSAEILVGIGPSIGSCCFEVEEATAAPFMALPEPVIRDCIEERPDRIDPSKKKFDIDLQGINRNLLLQAGVAPGHIQIADLCTRCNEDWLFSHRASKGKRGGMIAIIGIKQK